MQRIPLSSLRRAAPPDDPALIARGTDPATGLLSRDALTEVLARRAADEHHLANGFALLLVAVEGAAPDMPSTAARRLRANIRGADIVAHWDDSVFAVLMPDTSGEHDAHGLASRLVTLARRAFGGEAGVTACRVGLAVYPIDAWEPAALVQHAEDSLRGAGTSAPPPRTPRLRESWERQVA